MDEHNRKEALVEAAFRLIATKGFEGFRLRAVADEVGIDHSTLHHHFRTKQDLIQAVVERATMPLRSTMPVDGSPIERLRRHLRMLADLIEAQPDLFLVLSEIDLRALRDVKVRGVIERVEQGWRRALDDVLDGSTEAVEFVIATVKGVRLQPAMATAVLALLAESVIPAAAFEGEPR